LWDEKKDFSRPYKSHRVSVAAIFVKESVVVKMVLPTVQYCENGKPINLICNFTPRKTKKKFGSTHSRLKVE